MKFAKQLGAHITPEWRKQYIQYDNMKAMLEKHMEAAPDPEATDSEEILRYHTHFDENWFFMAEEELKKMCEFYQEKVNDASKKYQALKGELERSEDASAIRDQDGIYRGKRNNKKELKLAYSEFYLSLILLQNYSKFNQLGFKKIMKKFDKNMKTNAGAKFVKNKAKSSIISDTTTIDKMIVQIEDLVCNELDAGDRKRAMVRLKIQPYESRNTTLSSLKVGFFTGCFFILIVAIFCSIGINSSFIVPENPTSVPEIPTSVSSLNNSLSSPSSVSHWIKSYKRKDELEDDDSEEDEDNEDIPSREVVVDDEVKDSKQGGKYRVNESDWGEIIDQNKITAIKEDGKYKVNGSDWGELVDEDVVIASIEKGKYTVNGTDWGVVIQLYRGPFLVILLIILLGINIHGWASSGVNHVLIFELDPRNHVTALELVKIGVLLGCIWSVSLLLFLFAPFLSFPAFYSPLALYITLAAFFLNPTKTLHFDARSWLLRILGRIFLAPLCYVGFADFWLADQLNSLAAALTDFHFVACFYLSEDSTIDNEWSVAPSADICNTASYWMRPVISTLPAFWRFVQCLRRYRDTRAAFPHLVNGAKYSTTFLCNAIDFIHLAVVHPEIKHVVYILWIVSKIISSSFTLTWDLKMDWGFFSANPGGNKYLREEVIFDFKMVYYLAILQDVILRFSWSIGAALTKIVGVNSHFVKTVLTLLEVFRRFTWNFFRLENEHLNNCGQFRVVRDIKIAPIDLSEQEELLLMMDAKDGDEQIRRRKRGAQKS